LSDTRARRPSRTLVDPLDAFTDAIQLMTLEQAIQKAHQAAENTRDLVALAGRSAYLNQEELARRRVPDPGAWGVWRILDGIQGYVVE
jgi:dihydroxyacetone kinase